MADPRIRPDYIFSVSWEVCNKVGGIYTVLSTQAKTLKESSAATLIYIGPDLWKGKDNSLFTEDPGLYGAWLANACRNEGLSVRVGRWNIPGNPIVFLVDFQQYFNIKDLLYSSAWELYGVDSLHAYGDYDEASMFSFAAAMVVKSFYNYNISPDARVVYHAHEWMTGMGALMIKHFIPQIATVFTTHATSIGRSICGNGKNLYEYFDGYHGDQMASELNMESKHSVEKQAAHHVDCFTTVSDITARECTQLLDITPHVITENGFENDFVPSGADFRKKRADARRTILSVANSLFGTEWADETCIIGIGGRYEFRNKGLDLFIESMRNLRDSGRASDSHVLALINVPGWMREARADLGERIQQKKAFTAPLDMPLTTHWLHDMAGDRILGMLQANGFHNAPGDNVKVLLVPCYLDGKDGIFNKTYYDLLIGQDLAVYPSYYEPWGYTPLESAAFHVPTVTSDLAGFGLWVNGVKGRYGSLCDGVAVIHRTDGNWSEASDSIAGIVGQWLSMDDKEKAAVRTAASRLASKALWKNFIVKYLEAYSLALEKSIPSDGAAN